MRKWQTIKEYEDIKFDFFEGIAKITINRPRVYNAFRPQTNKEMLDAMTICRERNDIGVVVLTGAGDKAFCSGGDQHVKGVGGYIDENGVPRLNVLDLHKAIRSLPKPVIAMVNGYAIGGGHVLHVICDLTIASENARFGQTGPEDLVLRIWLVVSDRKKHVRSGFFVGNIQPKKPKKWEWSIKWFPSNNWKTRRWIGVKPL